MKPPLPKNLEKSGFVYATKIWSVKGRIKCVKILGIKIILDYAQAFAEPLKMHDLTLPEESYGIDDVGIVYHSQNIVIGGAGLLFCSKIFR